VNWDHEQLAVHVAHGEVHATLGVLEHTQAFQLAGDAVGLLGAVAVAHPE
jgi:hypothetical protein